MKIIAKTIKGHEYMYDPRTARKVSNKNADLICKIVNEHKTILGAKENEVFHVYTIDEYSKAWDYAQYQSFTIRNGVVTARAH
jgi:hypothetical protein